MRRLNCIKKVGIMYYQNTMPALGEPKAKLALSSLNVLPLRRDTALKIVHDLLGGSFRSAKAI